MITGRGRGGGTKTFIKERRRRFWEGRPKVGKDEWDRREGGVTLLEKGV